MFVVDNKRIATMRKHLGKASELNKSSTNQLKWRKLNATLSGISRQFGL